jgi:hypothetical protein
MASLSIFVLREQHGYFADSINSADRQQFGSDDHSASELSLPRLSATARP